MNYIEFNESSNVAMVDPNGQSPLTSLHGITLPLCRIDFAPQVILSQIRRAKTSTTTETIFPLRNLNIKTRYADGESLNDLANAYGVSTQRIWQIIKGRNK